MRITIGAKVRYEVPTWAAGKRIIARGDAVVRSIDGDRVQFDTGYVFMHNITEVLEEATPDTTVAVTDGSLAKADCERLASELCGGWSRCKETEQSISVSGAGDLRIELEPRFPGDWWAMRAMLTALVERAKEEEP